MLSEIIYQLGYVIVAVGIILCVVVVRAIIKSEAKRKGKSRKD